jgi:DNA repair protein RecO (recombination protein O)
MNTPLLEPAFVLHTRAYRNTSLLVDLFTQNTGRITVVAKGVKQSKSALRSSLQMFQPLLVSTYGHGELLGLKTAEIPTPFSMMPARYLAWGMYVNELLYRLLEKQDPYPNIFEHYYELLQLFSDNVGEEKHLRIFERDLLSSLGYGLQLTQVSESHAPIDLEAHYHFLFEKGPILAESTELNHPFIFKGTSLLAIEQGVFENEVALHDAKKLLRYAIQHLLGNKPIKSRELFFGGSKK